MFAQTGERGVVSFFDAQEAETVLRPRRSPLHHLQLLPAMHANPAQRKLVKHPKDWLWSSWSYYAKSEEGLVPIDALGEEPNRKENLQAVRKKSQKPYP